MATPTATSSTSTPGKTSTLSTTSGVTGGTRGKGRRLSNRERLEVIKQHEEYAKSVSDLAEKFSVSATAVRKTLKRRSEIKDITRYEEFSARRQRIAAHPVLESRLNTWYQILKKFNIKVTRQMLLHRAKREVENLKLDDFKASDGWLRRFVSRYGLKTERLCDESHHQDSFSTQLAGYDPDQIYSVDATLLFYNSLPNLESLKYLHEDASPVEVITVIIGCNSTGTHKIPLAVIGKQIEPLCFQDISPPLSYISQPNSWLDEKVLKEWFFKVFYPSVKCHTTRNVVVLCANSPGHGVLVTQDKVATMHFFPNSITSTSHDPLNLGILKAFKNRYRFDLLKMACDVTRNLEILKTFSHQGEIKNGLHYGYLPNLLDAMELLEVSWNAISLECIASAWKASGLLTPAASLSENNPSQLSSFFTEEDNNIVQKMILYIHSSGLLFNEEQTRMELQTWLEEEENINEKVRFFIHEMLDSVGENTNDIHKNDSHKEQTLVLDPPSWIGAKGILHKLKEFEDVLKHETAKTELGKEIITHCLASLRSQRTRILSVSSRRRIE